MRVALAAVLVIAGALACAYGAIIWASIPRSDTATWSLLLFGGMFALPGFAAVAVAARLLRRRG